MVELIEALEAIRGREVDIYTEHMLFENQHIKGKFVPESNIGFGFRFNGQTIYINEDDVVDYVIKNKEIIINGNMMTIKIKLDK